jgi:hypothetical protein
MGRTDDGSSVLATSNRRQVNQRIREGKFFEKESSAALIGPDSPMLTLQWPERGMAADIMASITSHIIRYYDGKELECSLWLCLKDPHVVEIHDKIRVVLRQLLEAAGWKIRFANGGPDERIFLSK